MSISAVITAAGKNSRMQRDQKLNNLDIINKLVLPYKNSTVLDNTIENVLSSNIDECIVVLGHFRDEIIEGLFNNYDNKVNFVENEPVDVGLSTSLFNGIKNLSSKYVLCVTGDQPTVSSQTMNNIIDTLLKSKNPDKTVSVLRRRKIGILNTAEGLGMPFAMNRQNLMDYIEKEDDNLNPILRKIFKDGYEFIGIKEKNKEELMNINHYKDYKNLLDIH